MPRARRRFAAARGFTLVELLVGVLLTGLVSSAVYGIFFSTADTSRGHESQARSQSDARHTLGLLGRDLRQAVAPPGLAAGRPVHALGAAELVIHVDPAREADPAREPLPQRVRYALEAGALVREAAAPVTDAEGGVTGYGGYAGREILAEGVLNTIAEPVFAAVAADGAPAAANGSVAQVSVRLILGHAVGRSAVSDEATLSVTLRNA